MHWARPATRLTPETKMTACGVWGKNEGRTEVPGHITCERCREIVAREVQEKERVAAERFALFIDTFASDARNNRAAGEEFADVPLQEAAALLRLCQETHMIPQLRRLFIDFIGYMVQERMIEPIGLKPMVVNLRHGALDWLESEPKGFRDLYWCWIINEPEIALGDGECPGCKCKVADVVDRHTFIAHVKKRSD